MIDFSDELLDKKRNGASNSELREELLLKNYSAEEIKELLKRIDHRFLREVKVRSIKKEINVNLFIGSGLVVFGSIITIGSFTGLVNFGNYSIITYGPIIGGLSMMAANRSGGGYFKRRLAEIERIRFRTVIRTKHFIE